MMIWLEGNCDMEIYIWSSYKIVYKETIYKLLQKEKYATYAEDKSFVEVKMALLSFAVRLTR